MAFSIAARMLLELGKELISSDEVAVYEILKNAIDAGSPKVEIAATVVVSHRHLVAALEMLEDGRPGHDGGEQGPASPSSIEDALKRAEAVCGHLRANILPDAPGAPRAAFVAGVQTASDELRDWILASDAIDELEALANRVASFATAIEAVYATTSWIDFIDEGHGMGLAALNEVFLRIGTNSRHARNTAGASYLGDKGVGRLSAMRLGETLAVQTGTEDDDRWNLLEIDWRVFSHDVDVDLDEIEVDPVRGGPKRTGVQGTRLRVAALSADWSKERFAEMFQGKIARMIDPFTAGRANALLTIRHNDTRILVPSIPKPLLADAHATCRGSFSIEGDIPAIDGEVRYRIRQKSVPIGLRGAEVMSVAQHTVKRRGKRAHAASTVVPMRLKALRDLGPFDFEIYWYNRRLAEAVEDLTEGPGGTRAEIARWAGGPMLYRGDFRILPYGEPSNDWLALDQIAFGASGFKLNRQQVIGRVRVSSPHSALGEQTNREGLVQSDAADALRTIMYWIVHSEMRGLINEADKLEKINKRVAEEAALDFRRKQDLVREAIERLRSGTDETQRQLADDVATSVDDLADQCASMVKRIDGAVREAVGEREKFVHLAGIGLMTEFIFHELNRSVEHTLELLGSAKRSERQTALLSLETQLQTLQKRIAAFDEMAGERRQSKSTFDLKPVIQLVLDNHVNEFERHGIAVRFDAPVKPYPVKAVRGMVVQILENLVVNATYWLKRQRKWQPGFEPELTVTLDAAQDVLCVEDNGPGVDPRRADHIFQPFVTSKPADQGRGLGLFISRDMAEHNGWTLSLDAEVGRRRPDRSNMFVIDMGT